MLREGYEVYEGYIDNHKEEIEQGKDFIVEIRNLATFERMIVRAIVSRDPNGIEGGSSLWIKDFYDEIIPHPGSIKILEELDDEEFQAEKSAKADLIKGRGRGGGRTKTELKD
jgi:hypothetical protein